MQQALHDFINVAKAKALEVKNKQPTQALFNSFESQNTIFNQQKYIHLDKMQLQAVRESIVCLDKTNEMIMATLAALGDFHHLDLGALRMAGNFSLGTSFMLEEYLNQQKGVSIKVCDFATRGVAR